MISPKIIFPFAQNNQPDQVTVFDSNTTWGYSKDNKDYIDLSLGSCGCFPLGFKRLDFIDYVSKNSKEFTHLTGEFLSTNEVILNLAETFSTYTNGYKSIFALSGSDAVESAVRAATLYHKLTGGDKKQIMMGFEDSYHGSTYISSSISGSTYLHEVFGRHPLCVTLSYDIEQIICQIDNIGPNNISCLIVETCSWQRGLYIQPDSWWQQIRKICTDNNIIFIIDDIAFCGAKTENYFGYNQFANPDMVTFGKAISGGYYPLSGVLVSTKLYDVIKETNFLHGFTYSFSMTGILSATYYAEVVKKENILTNHCEVSRAAFNLIENLKNTGRIINARNYGMMWCIELDTKNLYSSIDISNLFLNNGLYLGIWNNVDNTKIAGTKKLYIQFPAIYDQEYFTNLQTRLENTLTYSIAGSLYL